MKTKNLLLGMGAVCGASFQAIACTGIALTAADGSYVQSRTIEWARGVLQSEYVVIPRGQRLRSFTPSGTDGMTFTAKYGVVGLSVVQKEFIAEGINEAGLSAGLFFFPQYGGYEPYEPARNDRTLADLQFVAWVLTQFSTIDEVKAGIGEVCIVGLEPASVVHWRIGEPSGRQVVLEIVGGVPHFYENEIGVLTNAFNAMSRQLQSTLQEVESERTKLSTLFLHMTDGVVAFNQSGEVIHSNPAAEEMLGQAIPVGGAVTYGDLFQDMVPLETVLTTDRDCLEIETVWGERILLLLLAPFNREKQVGVLVVVHDVTQQVKNETMRKEFVANVSHELRTPITNIRSYAETLAENPDLPPDTTASFLGVILSESDRMTHIVQDLLTLSRFDSGHSELNLTTFPFAGLLEESCQAMRIEAQRRGHTLRLEGTGGLPAIRADRERISQVVMNVLSNAIKYTPDGGRIVLTAGCTPDRVWLEVADNGIGIPPEDRDRIFERFYRVDKARSRESGGTGLGLSIAQEIVRQHQGSLTLVDRPGPGTTLRLELKREGPDR